jgi:thioredoxin-like negative regulator of GroEL
MTRRFLTRLIACCAACCAAAPAPAQAPATEVEWRLDYDKARKEAEAKGRPLVIDISTDNCFWCKQLETRTFRDPAVVTVLNERCIPLKVDASVNPRLANALGVQTYPTLVFAGPDGKIIDLQTGFVEAPGFQDKVQRTLAVVSAPPDWMTRDLQEATRAAEAADFVRAAVLLAKILEDGKDRPVQGEARRLLGRLEEQAAGRHARARALAEQGKVAEAVETVAETVRLYPGTRAAQEGSRLLVTMVSRSKPAAAPAPVSEIPPRTRAVRELLEQARADFDHHQLLACMDRCETVLAEYADLPESEDAARLVGDIKTNPELTKQAAEQLGDRLSQLYLSMADSWLRKGQPKQAVFYLERVVQTFPSSRHAELAQVKLAQIQGAPVRVTDRK